MKRLFEIDVKDYETGYKVYRGPSARGINEAPNFMRDDVLG